MCKTGPQIYNDRHIISFGQHLFTFRIVEKYFGFIAIGICVKLDLQIYNDRHIISSGKHLFTFKIVEIFLVLLPLEYV